MTEEEESKDGNVERQAAFGVTDVATIAKILAKVMEIDWRKNWVIYPIPMT